MAWGTPVRQRAPQIPLLGLSAAGKWVSVDWDWGTCVLILLHFRFATPGYRQSGELTSSCIRQLQCKGITFSLLTSSMWTWVLQTGEGDTGGSIPLSFPNLSCCYLQKGGGWHWWRNAAAFLHNLRSLQEFHPPLGNFVRRKNFTSYNLWGLLLLNSNKQF